MRYLSKEIETKAYQYSTEAIRKNRTNSITILAIKTVKKGGAIY